MEKINDFKHLNDTITKELVPQLYMNNFPQSGQYRRLLLQIMIHFDALRVDNDILFRGNDAVPLTFLEIPHQDILSGELHYYKVIKRMTSVTNIYEIREKIGGTIHPRWIIFPLQDVENSIVFTFFFEKLLNNPSSDLTQMCVVESQMVHDEIRKENLPKSILSEGL